MRVAFRTFGCKLNQAETESVIETFTSRGHSIVSASGNPDIHIVNTCVVTSKSAQKVRGWIRRVSRLDTQSLVLAAGCYAQVDGHQLAELCPNVLVVPQSHKAVLHDLAEYLKRTGPILAKESLEKKKQRVENHLRQLAEHPAAPFSFDVRRYSLHSRAFVKIQDGCGYHCAYCIVPRARGPSVSLETGEVLERVRRLEEQGYREVVLTGVNIASYEHDGAELASLLPSMLEATSRLRIRLSSLEPDRIDRRLRDAVADKRICPHFHIPVQSGSDRILKAMRRQYDARRVLDGIQMLREVRPEAHVAGDFMVGFPGETESDHHRTEEVVRTGGFARLHVFPFSPREGTAAQKMKRRVPERIKKARAERLREISSKQLQAYIASWSGRAVAAVIEGDIGSDGTAAGLSENYLKLVIRGIPRGEGRDAEDVRAGSLVECRISGPEDPCTAEFLRSL